MTRRYDELPKPVPDKLNIGADRTDQRDTKNVQVAVKDAVFVPQAGSDRAYRAKQLKEGPVIPLGIVPGR